ncbi:MAG: hypothetical protein PF904_21580 [Kiritimatiellae bacterium]|nr:hypothetical protein [Kiritimatiellia bacterium]
MPLCLCGEILNRAVTLVIFCGYFFAIPTAIADLRFVESGAGYTFNTGSLKGTLRKDGKSFGAGPVIDLKSGINVAAPLGLLTPYRLLDAESRYLPDARGWKSSAKLQDDGAVKVKWQADKNHPFDLQIIYRWASLEVLDAIVTVRAKKFLPRFEVFMTCYFNGFNLCHGSGKDGLVGADHKYGDWLCFPRDDDARKIIDDGRWKHPPNAVEFMPVENYMHALGMRTSLDSGLMGLMMSSPKDCFAVLMPHHEDKHYSLYCSLFGYDIEADQSATAKCRVIIDRNLSEKDVVGIYEKFVGKTERPTSN